MQILAGLVLLGVLIVFHELGHFLVAKWLGVRVLVFSVGFGPKICSFKWGDTEYRLSAIPLGGYIRLFGESLDEELTPEEKRMSFMHQAIWRKSLIAVAGPVFNFILPVILFFCLLLGSEQIFAPKVGTVLESGPAGQAGLMVGDEITHINNKKLESFGELAKIVSSNYDKKLNFSVIRKSQFEEDKIVNLEIIPEVKAVPNLLDKEKKVGRIGIMPAVQKPVIILNPKSEFAKNGFNNFDEIVSIGDISLGSAQEFKSIINKIKAGEQVIIKRGSKNINLAWPQVIRSKHEKKNIIWHIPQGNFKTPDLEPKVIKTKKLLADQQDNLLLVNKLYLAQGSIKLVEKDSQADKLGIKVGDRIISVNGDKILNGHQIQEQILGRPDKQHVLGVLSLDLTPRIIIFNLPDKLAQNISLNSNLQNLFGIEITKVFAPGEMRTRKVGVIEAITRATEQTYDIAALTAKSLWLLVRGEVPTSQIGGPIMLFDVASQAAKKGLSYYIFIMCLISVNLGLLNLLPIPALDGGHLLLFGIEAVQRKPLTPRTRAIATQIGFALLLFVMGMAIFNDIRRLFN